MSSEATPWWSGLTAERASTCSEEITQFLANPTREKADSFGQSLAVFILLGGDLGPAGEFLRSKEPHYEAVGQGLRECKGLLEKIGSSLPVDLQKACPPEVSLYGVSTVKRLPPFKK